MRPGEVNGKDYYFVSREQMEREIRYGHFLEHGEHKSNLYGVSIETVMNLMKEGKVPVLDLHPQVCSTPSAFIIHHKLTWYPSCPFSSPHKHSVTPDPPFFHHHALHCVHKGSFSRPAGCHETGHAHEKGQEGQHGIQCESKEDTVEVVCTGLYVAGTAASLLC